MQFVRRVVPPQGRAWSNARLAQELGRRLGLADPIFSMDTDGLLRELFRGARSPAAAVDLKELRAGGAVKLAPEPGHQRFATPSEKLEFYSETLAGQGLPAMPDWVGDPDESAMAERFPLRLLTAPGYFQAHTAWAGVATLRRRAGEPECVLHPEDAAVRGLRNGQTVRLESQHGTLRLRLRVSDETGRGVVFVPGQRPAARESGTINMLCSDRYSDLGEGATYQSTRLQVSAIPDEGASA